ncbi:hypothetical protein CEXT_356001 [Caerostris extrusa]|uniref:Uncharacterized protein n=1 Tax=Caerostris extrusa TaxID=172846 RepID=A0AAV4QW61_CAEEX|nr:hypothetical protein CEXT_356001 [Caerostris extrusa]
MICATLFLVPATPFNAIKGENRFPYGGTNAGVDGCFHGKLLLWKVGRLCRQKTFAENAKEWFKWDLLSINNIDNRIFNLLAGNSFSEKI